MMLGRTKIAPLHSPSSTLDDSDATSSSVDRKSQYKRTSQQPSQRQTSALSSVVGDEHRTRGSTVQSQTTRSEDIGMFRLSVIKIHRRASSRNWTILITIVTMYALFGDDIRLMAFDKEVDWLFNVLSTLSLCIFAGELFVSTIADKQHRFSFYFWLDFIATITMIPDIGWIWDPFVELLFTGDEANIGGVTKGLQASRVGSKSSRVVRIVRLVRLIRIAKLWKVHGQNRGENDVSNEVDEEPSMVGKKMSEMTMRRVITLVLTMLLLLPFFDDTFYESNANVIPNQLSHIHRMAQDYNVTQEQFNFYVQEFTRKNGRLVHLKVCSDIFTECKRYNSEPGGVNINSTWEGISSYLQQDYIASVVKTTMYTDPDTGVTVFQNPADTGYIPNDNWKDTYAQSVNDFRTTEVDVTNITACYDADHQLSTTRTRCSSVAVFDVKASGVFSAMLNVLKTIFVIFVLGGGATMFTRDADVLVIAPIERMVQCVKQLAENPMANGYVDDDDEMNTGGYETLLLERTIKKIGKLLQVGFGEAGSAIINKNMLSSGGVIDPMVKGHKVTAVFGFCDIRNFTDTTECLQSEVMVYVNKVGDIVHSATHAYNGAANKNIGDAFLLVWRIDDSSNDFAQAHPQKKTSKHETAAEKTKREQQQIIKTSPSAFWGMSKKGNMCDSALVAFLKILVDLKRENEKGGCLYSYKHHPAILKRFGPEFEIKLGMGLHIGWAIEGAIGSHFKIDASYLSPNVNMSARLEAATKQFLTPLLLSHWFVEGLSSVARKRCRQIDCVTVKGSLEPMGIWTFDINTYPDFFADVDSNSAYQHARNGQPAEPRNSLTHILEVEMTILQEGVAKEFVELFNKGMSAYLDGDWSRAERFLRDALLQKDDEVGDGPTESLLKVMQNMNFTAPEDWKGFRELTEK